MLKRFAIYGTIGWGMEIFWTGLGSLFMGNWELPGHTYIWMFPIYGLAVFLEPVQNKIEYLPWYLRGTIWAVIIFSLEYLTGGILIGLLGECPWDYSNSTFYHVQGIIRLDYFPVWFVVGLLFERIHDNIDEYKI
ncbi:MAG: hypothetical protein PHI90_01410 [Clostridia bacterium]|nr:hypothetical protein [Clostridia bacterium]MDD4047483.1 hypothetical protein [Clostridia bacterium]